VPEVSPFFYVFLLVLVISFCLVFDISCVIGCIVFHRLVILYLSVLFSYMVGCSMLIEEELFVP
jgi:hypothetical protein